jgi:hypothetical protein
VPTCPDCGFDRRKDREETAMRSARRDTCTACGGGTTVGSMEFRTGGHSGTAVFLFGGIAEAGEEMVTLVTRTCRVCGHIDFYRR